MAPCLDPREILSHLNQLGYTHIEANQLKEFMKGKQITNCSILFYYCCFCCRRFEKAHEIRE